jgi:hypothetical protein
VNNLTFNIGDRSLIQLISRDESMTVRRIHSTLTVQQLSADRVLLLGYQAPQVNSTGNLAISVDLATRTAEGSPFHWILKRFGFEIGHCSDRQFPLKIFVTRLPYWSLVLPFTLLSAYLLLGKQNSTIKDQGKSRT